LLLLASAAFEGRVEAATVDHGLRPESPVEALHVEDICERIGCAHTILNVTVDDGAAGVQAEARRARYQALSDWAARQDIAHLATAHHADDQAETVLMRLQRGSGVAGLAGIRPRRREGPLLILRPLLGWTKAELVHLVSRSGVEAVDDPSNQDTRFDRAAMRRFLVHNPQFQPQRLSRTAAAMRAAEEALVWTVEQLAEDRITSAGGEWRIEIADLPRELKRRLLIRAIAEVRLEAGLETVPPRGEELESLIDTLEGGGTRSLAAINARGGSAWLLRLAPPRRRTRS
jgi:tRNA(Ile)-lysidine synthase